MRVSSLSDERVQRIIARHFVPVWVSRDRYQMAPASREEKDFLARLDASRRRKKLVGGAVCVYLVDHAGEVSACLPVQQASKPDLLIEFLTWQVREQKLTAREAPAAEKPARPAGGFIVRTRLDTTPNRGTSRDVIELTAKQTAALVPSGSIRVGQTHDVPADVAAALLRYAYPPLPHWDAKLAKVETARLRATVVAVEGGAARLRLEGRVEMIYPDRGKPDDARIEARLVGLARVSLGGALREWVLVSERATHTWHWNGKPIVRKMSLAVEYNGPP